MSHSITSDVAAATPHDSANRARRIPLGLKLAYTVFLGVLVPYYWKAYTPWNFLYFCDVALLVTLVGMWTESALLISTQAVAILLPQTIWVIDFMSRACGHTLLKMTDYMFNPSLPLFTRGLSLFHGWLPFLLVYLIWKVGYDRRAFLIQCVFGVALLWACFFFAPAPPAPLTHPNMAVNVNYVWGIHDHEPQHSMPPFAWVALLNVVFITGLYTPTHLVLRKLARQPV